jgi:phage terminase Nu1 subunit (DNA packaging protein)
MSLAEIKAAKYEVSWSRRKWSGILRKVRAAILAVPSRVAARLPHLSRADVAEIDAEVRAALTEMGDC